MTASEKALELVGKLQDHADVQPDWLEETKKCAIICVDEIINSCQNHVFPDCQHPMAGYWKEVRNEIFKIKYSE